MSQPVVSSSTRQPYCCACDTFVETRTQSGTVWCGYHKTYHKLCVLCVLLYCSKFRGAAPPPNNTCVAETLPVPMTMAE